MLWPILTKEVMLQDHILVAEIKASPTVAAKQYCHWFPSVWNSFLFHLRVRIILILANSTAMDALNEHPHKTEGFTPICTRVGKAPLKKAWASLLQYCNLALELTSSKLFKYGYVLQIFLVTTCGFILLLLIWLWIMWDLYSLNDSAPIMGKFEFSKPLYWVQVCK